MNKKWLIEKIWWLNYGQLSLDYSLLDKLPKITFFNFSSIVYSMNDRNFIIGKPFLNFLYNKKLDIVLEANPLPSLCIVNSFYYSDKFNLKLSDKLINYIISHYKLFQDDFECIQLKHFGEIKYSTHRLLKKIRKVESKKVSEKSLKLKFSEHKIVDLR